jgi:hypothetical protein
MMPSILPSFPFSSPTGSRLNNTLIVRLGAYFSAAIGLIYAAAASEFVPAGPANSVAHDNANVALANSLATLVRHAIPQVTDKKEDWGATRNVTVGVEIEGKPFHWHRHRRTKAVNHGTWKHYTVRLVEPDKNLVVQVKNLQALPDGRFAFTLHLEAPLEAWGRAKVYQYGVHLISLEMEGDAKLRLEVDGQVGVRMHAADGGPGASVEPVITDARLNLDEFHIRRVSNAHGPLVRQLSDGVRRLVEDELDGPPLTAKLNRAIEKKRDRLSYSADEWWRSSWWPLGADDAAEAVP